MISNELQVKNQIAVQYIIILRRRIKGAARAFYSHNVRLDVQRLWDIRCYNYSTEKERADYYERSDDSYNSASVYTIMLVKAAHSWTL